MRELLKNYNSVLDYPAVVHYEKLYEAYPDAKFILVRLTADIIFFDERSVNIYLNNADDEGPRQMGNQHESYHYAGLEEV